MANKYKKSASKGRLRRTITAARKQQKKSHDNIKNLVEKNNILINLIVKAHLITIVDNPELSNSKCWQDWWGEVLSAIKIDEELIK